MARLRFVAAVALLGIGGFLAAYGLFSGGDSSAPVSRTYVERTACESCPVAIESVEVQERQGSTLFVFQGDWPASIAEVPADVRLEANDFEVVLRPNAEAEAFEIAEGSAAASPDTVAAGIVDGSLLVNLADGVVSTPVDFVFGLWDGQEFTARLPRSGELTWNGTGAPRPVGEEAPVEEPAEEPAEASPEAETPEEFLADLATALQEADARFLFERLNPAVLDVYGEDQCRTHTRGLQDPSSAFDIVRISDLEPYDYDPDGLTVTIPEAYTVTADITGTQGTNRGQVHVAPDDGLITWFTDCGDPV
jgi:hypothetical protein